MEQFVSIVDAIPDYETVHEELNWTKEVYKGKTWLCLSALTRKHGMLLNLNNALKNYVAKKKNLKKKVTLEDAWNSLDKKSKKVFLVVLVWFNLTLNV
jgi:hypothetical protein